VIKTCPRPPELSTSRKRRAVDQQRVSLGKIFLRKGRLLLDDQRGLLGRRKGDLPHATWETGTFELEPGGEMQVMNEVQESTEGLPYGGRVQLDESAIQNSLRLVAARCHAARR
jgi:hypothetical protein